MNFVKTSAATPFAWLLLFIVCLPQVSCRQTSRPSPDKAQVLKAVKVSSVDGWKEAISDTGRFRILFPREPIVVDSGSGATALIGYKLIEGETRWSAIYNDFPTATTKDPTQLRDAYRQSVQSFTKKGAKLLRQEEVVLNGKLGIEVAVEGRGTVSFIRAFLIDRRMYMLEVDSNNPFNGDSTLLKDVQQFFDSFTFWE